MRAGGRLRRDPEPTPLRVSISLACCSASNNRRITTGLVLTLRASNVEVTRSPFLYASTASVCTAMAKRQLLLMTSLRMVSIGPRRPCQARPPRNRVHLATAPILKGLHHRQVLTEVAFGCIPRNRTARDPALFLAGGRCQKPPCLPRPRNES